MAKYKTLTGGDGISGQTGLTVRGILNDMIPAEAYYIPEDFDFSINLSSLSNRTWVITYEHTLLNDITIPEGVTLFFDGGRITGAFTITGTLTKILNPRNTHIFGLTTNFAGIWTETKATPMWWGAKTTPNPDTFVGVSSASPALQKLFDSPFDVEFPNGYYYIDTAINISRPITADFGSRYETQATVDKRAGRLWRNDHVRFYTNQNINFWNIRTYGVYLLGGVMDVWNSPTWNSTIYYMHCNYKCFEGRVSGYCIGTKTLVLSGSNGRGFFWDTNNATVDWGYACNIKVDIYTYCIPIGIEIGDKEIAQQVVTGTWSNLWYSHDTWIEGARVACILRGYVYAKIYGQDEAILNGNERNTQIAQIYDCEELDIHIADLFNREEPIGSDRWYHKQVGAYMLNKPGVTLVGSLIGVIRYKGFTGETYRTDKSIEPGQSITQLRKTGNNLTTFISELHNMLPIYAQDAEVLTAKFYDGSTMNFDTDLLSGAEYSLPETNRIQWSGYLPDPMNLFRYRGRPVYFDVIDPRLTDFIEIRMKLPTTVRMKNFWIRITDGGTAIQRIQIITVSGSDTRNMVEWPIQISLGSISSTRVIKLPVSNSTYKEIIIRFIGFLAASIQSIIEDIATEGDPEKSQTYVNRLENPKSEFHLMLNQSGTNAPVVTPLLNPYAESISATREGVGSYRLNVPTTEGKVMPLRSVIYTDLGSIVFSRYNASYYTITTRDLSDTLSDSILVNQPFIINRYW